MQPEFPIYIPQGATFDQTFNYYGGGIFVAPIEDIREGYPTLFNIKDHSLNNVSTTPVIISGVEGLEHVNSEDTEIHVATYIDADWFSMPVSSVGEEWTNGTGEITYWKPSNITGWGGECNIRKNWHSDILLTLSTELGNMVLNGTDGSIQLTATPEVTKVLTIVNGIYDVDLWPGGGARPTDGSPIYRLFSGPVKMQRDI